MPSRRWHLQVVRGGPAFAVSLVLSAIEPALRASAELGAWQLISPGDAVGRVVVVSGLHEVQDEVPSIPHPTPTPSPFVSTTHSLHSCILCENAGVLANEDHSANISQDTPPTHTNTLTLPLPLLSSGLAKGPASYFVCCKASPTNSGLHRVRIAL